MNRTQFLLKSWLLLSGGMMARASGLLQPATAVAALRHPEEPVVTGRHAFAESGAGHSFSEHPANLRSDGASASRITILYTNDTHARIDPFPEHAVEHAGLGGVAQRAELVRQIRRHTPHCLLLDAGDLFHDAPWFRLLGGERLLKLMSDMGYDAMGIGENEFIEGPEGLARAAAGARFPLLCANYRVKGTPLEGVIRQSVIRIVGGIRIGIFGLGLRLSDHLQLEKYDGVLYGDPSEWAERMVQHLRQRYRCDYIICLSHLGHHYSDGRIDDLKLASHVEGIDLIIGGHTHTFLKAPVAVNNPGGGVTWITQAGHSGVRLGRIDLIAGPEGEIHEQVAGFYSIREETGRATNLM